MANVIKCPSCGENNLSDQEFCQYCQTRLQPLTGNLKGADAPLKPGEFPTKKNTADLEPILPQWLREARNSARNISLEDETPDAQPPQEPQAPEPPQASRPASFAGDLLAGLQAQRQAQDNDEEDTPDWLANITGETPKSKKSQTESSDVRWVELGDANDFAQSEPVSDTPSWLAGISPLTQQSAEKDELADWLRDVSDSQKPQQPSQPTSFDSPPSDAGTQDWLHSMAEDDGAFSDSGNAVDEPLISSDTPDWLRAMDAENNAQNANVPSNTGTLPVDTDTPDWLRTMAAADNDVPLSISGTLPVSSDMSDWLRSMDAENNAQNANVPSNTGTLPVDTDTPDWLHTMAAADNDVPLSTSGTPPVSSDMSDWLRSMDAENNAQNANVPSNTGTLPVDSDTPDWLRTMAADNDVPLSTSGIPPVSSDDTPDWLRTMAAADNDTQSSASGMSPASSDDTPDWLRTMAADNDTQSSASGMSPASSDDMSDWLRAIDAQEKTQSPDSAGFSETGLDESDAESSSAMDTAKWLKGLESGTSSADQDWLKELPSVESEQPEQDSAPAWLSAAPTFTPEQEQTPAAPEKDDDADIPAWLISTAALAALPKQEQSPLAPEKDDDALDIPNWLKAAAPQSSIFDEPTDGQEIAAPAPSSSDSSDWLNTFKSVDALDSQPISALSMEEHLDSEQPVFADEAKPSTNEDALFTDMPAWLSIVDETVSPESSPTPITNEDAILPGDLPSWVQAMRPVDAGVSLDSSTVLSSDKKLEASGALAGLQGVLPAVPGFSPTSKPKAYSIMMQASEEQQAHAALLERILAAETEPVPIGSFSTLGTSRPLRWVIALVLFAALTTVLFMQRQIFSMPVGLPVEVVSALNVVQSIPEGAPVLAVFDYEPARVGEMEVAAAPVFDQMILLHHPRLTFISTNETGAILAERLISGPLAGHNYQSGVQYLNLGYLPGGQMGIRAFAENPSVTAPYAFAQSSNLFNFISNPAWSLPPLQDVKSLSQFAALILITDNADTARAWIEQTASARGEIPFLVISSAQATPMVQPYYASRQVDGLVSGLYGGALFEQNNAGRPGTARIYWDAYSIGMLLAMALILGGGLLNLVLGINDRTAAREAK